MEPIKKIVENFESINVNSFFVLLLINAKQFLNKNDVGVYLICDRSFNNCYVGASKNLKRRTSRYYNTIKNIQENNIQKEYNSANTSQRLLDFLSNHNDLGSIYFIILQKFSSRITKQELIDKEKHWYSLIQPNLNIIEPNLSGVKW